MTNFFQFVVLGLGVGAVYALFAQGIVVIYRGSGLVNLAHGAIGTLSAYLCFVTLYKDVGLTLFLSILGGVACGAVVAVLFQVLILARLSSAAPIVSKSPPSLTDNSGPRSGATTSGTAAVLVSDAGGGDSGFEGLGES